MDAWESSSLLTSDLYNTSNLSLDDDYDLTPWMKILQHLNESYLQALKGSFNEKCFLKDSKSSINLENGLTKEEFTSTISEVFGDSKLVGAAIMMFNEIDKEENGIITWNQFLDFAQRQLEPMYTLHLDLNEPQIINCPHVKRETVVKIVSIETEKYFCYAIISKHGCVGLYDGNMNFLTSYVALMSREDIDRIDEERRRRNRWITDAIFIPEELMFIVTNTARSIVIYDASNLHHIALWLILGIPTMLHCLAYSFKKEQYVMYAGNECGEMISFNFLQPSTGLLRKKHNDKITLFYWQELKNEKDYLQIKSSGRIHWDPIRHIQYIPKTNAILTCSRDPEKSLIIKFVDNRVKPYIFKMKRGVNCFHISPELKILVTGSEDGVLRIWNSVITSNPVSILKSHKCGIIDVVVLDSQKSLISLSRDAILKLWDLKEYVCIKSVKIKFPSFKEMGKMIEWGKQCIFSGPKRAKPSEEIISSVRDDEWERTNILVSCCNYISSIKFIFLDGKERCLDYSILPPPPLQNSVLIPTNWKISDGRLDEKVQPVLVDAAVEKYIETLNFILEKDLLTEGNLNNEINFKIARLEERKQKMRSVVAQGAPYLALELPDIEEIKLSCNLPIPDNKKVRDLVDKTQKILCDAGTRSLIFSTPSSSSRSRSSRTSIIEFD